MAHARSIAAAQPILRRGEVDANIEQHARLAHAAAREQVRVLVFPELSLTGYEPDLAAALAFSERDARLAPIIEASRSGRMTLIVGAPVRIESRLHIGAFILLPDGSVELYTKHHLGAGEETVFAPGERNPLVTLGADTAAVAVCADTNHASHPARAAERGADTYLVSSFLVPAELAAKTANLALYAQRHSMTVVFANHGAPTGGLDSAGRSAIWSAQGERLAQLPGIGTGLVVAHESATGWRARAIVLDDA